MIKATNIDWDIDVDEELAEEEGISLPDTIIIPHTIEEDDEDAISDYISDMTGFRHYGFDIEECDDDEVLGYIAEHTNDPVNCVYLIKTLLGIDSQVLMLSMLSEMFGHKYTEDELVYFINHCDI